MYRVICPLVFTALLGMNTGLVAQETSQIDFVSDIKPILEKRCIRCHSDPDPKEGIYLESAADVIDSYVFANDLEASDVYQRMITDDPDLLMPPPDDGGPMPREETLLVRLWITEGAEWPEDVTLERPTLDEQPQVPTGNAPRVDFIVDVKPILEEHCIECHGQQNTAEDIDFSTRSNVLGNYVLPHEPQSSSLFTRIVSDDKDKVMPPPSAGEPLSSAEQFVIQLWIDEGAIWPEGVVLGEVAAPVVEETSMANKVWVFQGYFHPATVHFPVALFSTAALFVVLYWLFGGGFRDAAFYCLVFGALASIAASVMGWSLSPTTGFGDEPFDTSNATFWHRWCGVAVSALSSLLAVMAIRARKSERARRLQRARIELPWQFGVILLAALVGLVGHQGGELRYGEDWYDRAFAMFDSTDESDDSTNGGQEATTDLPASNPDAATDSEGDTAAKQDTSVDGQQSSEGATEGTPGDDESGDNESTDETPASDDLIPSGSN